MRWIEEQQERLQQQRVKEQQTALEEARRKGDFWMHMMQFSVVTVFVVEVIWIVKNALSR